MRKKASSKEGLTDEEKQNVDEDEEEEEEDPSESNIEQDEAETENEITRKILTNKFFFMMNFLIRNSNSNN